MPLAREVDDRFRARIAGGELSLPLLPEVATQVLALADRQDCNAADLADLLRRDPALSAHVMRVAGSPVYAGATKAVSLQQVIGRLGFATITQIALVIATRMRVFEVGGFEDVVRGTFRHSLATALFAQEIARMRRSTVDVAFLAGLMHDLGRLLALQALVDTHRELAVPLHRDDILAAAATHHAELAGALIDHWGLPAKVAEAVRIHHAPLGHEVATTIALADRLAHRLDGETISSEDLAPALNLYPEDVAALVAKSEMVAKTIEVIG